MRFAIDQFWRWHVVGADDATICSKPAAPQLQLTHVGPLPKGAPCCDDCVRKLAEMLEEASDYAVSGAL